MTMMWWRASSNKLLALRVAEEFRMIQIQEPDIEALIEQRLAAGRFRNVEEVLRQALTDAPLPRRPLTDKPGPTGEEIIAASRGHRIRKSTCSRTPSSRR